MPSTDNPLTGQTPEEAAILDLLERVQRLERIVEEIVARPVSQVLPVSGVVR